MTKPLTLFSIAFMLFAVCGKADAQAIGYSNFGRNSSNQVFDKYMIDELTRRSRIRYSRRMFSENRITFDFFFKNSRRKLSTVSPVYMDTVKRKTYIEYTDITLRDNDPRRIVKIYPSDLQSISVRADIDHVFQPQLTTDSCWMFKAIKGEITVYSNGLAPVAMQKHDDAIQQFTKDGLLALIKEDKSAMELFDDGDYIKAIQKYNRNFKKAEDKAYDEAHRAD